MVEIRLDKSKPFGENHGDLTPDDPLYHVAYWQGGTMGGHKIVLPFDVHGNLVPDDGKTEPFEGMNSEGKKIVYQPLYNKKMRQYLEARKKRASEVASTPDPNAIDEETSHDKELGGAPEDEVNFQAWLRGEVKYPPFLLRAAARKVLSVAYQEVYPNLVVDLVLDRNLVPEDQVCADLRKYLPAKTAAA